MEKMSNNSVYDLAIIGNGIAAQSFLWNLQEKYLGSEQASKSQTFSIAHIYSEKIAPACSLRSSATISLNGIDEDVSPLGNDMRTAYFLFNEFVKKHNPEGVEEVKRVVVGTNDNDIKKLTRRYKTLSAINNPRLKDTFFGTEYLSFIISPLTYSEWLKNNLQIKKTDFPFFLKNLEKGENYFQLTLEDLSVIRAKKVLFATGAYHKIFEKFYSTSNDQESIEIKNTIKAGSFFERHIDLGPASFYLSIDGHQVLYRKNINESTLILGSATTIGAYEAPDLEALSVLFYKLKNLLTFEIGEIGDFKITTGLRHKGPKRMLMSEALNNELTLFRINGLYKNGYTMSLLAAQKMSELIKFN
jgi:hypothetical protein